MVSNIVHESHNAHNGATVAYYREQTVEITLSGQRLLR